MPNAPWSCDRRSVMVLVLISSRPESGQLGVGGRRSDGQHGDRQYVATRPQCHDWRGACSGSRAVTSARRQLFQRRACRPRARTGEAYGIARSFDSRAESARRQPNAIHRGERRWPTMTLEGAVNVASGGIWGSRTRALRDGDPTVSRSLAPTRAMREVHRSPFPWKTTDG